ncbi:MAG: hypothetical protein KDC26_02430 [Armatimonadetes bacterium]|nr:hypothetical protein [Armatimonadota bacterium]
MRARKLGYIVGACSPFLLLAVLGISGRFLTLPWVSPEYGEMNNRALMNYRDLVSRTHAVENSHDPNKDDHILQLAKDWQKGYLDGTLRPIPPADSGDIGSEGVRAEIESTKRYVYRAVTRMAAAVQAENPELALDYYALSLDLSKTCKYTSPISVTGCTTNQRTILTNLVALVEQNPGVSRRIQSLAILATPEEDHFSSLLHKIEARSNAKSIDNSFNDGYEEEISVLLASNGTEPYIPKVSKQNLALDMSMISLAKELEEKLASDVKEFAAKIQSVESQPQ